MIFKKFPNKGMKNNFLNINVLPAYKDKLFEKLIQQNQSALAMERDFRQLFHHACRENVCMQGSNIVCQKSHFF